MRSTFSLLFLVCFIFDITSLTSQCDPELIKDATTSPNCNGIGEMVQLNDTTILFSAWSEAYGQELYKMDGTANSEELVRDIIPGPLSSSPEKLIKLGGEIFYFATNQQAEVILGKSDGTLNGTSSVKNLGTIDNIRQVIKIDGLLFFTVDVGNFIQLWKSDGTTAGTDSLYQLDEIFNLSKYANMILFRGETITEGYELWSHDISSGVTSMIKDINVGSASGLPSGLIGDEFSGKFYFAADNGSSGLELWVTDGTSGGTLLLKDINVGANGSSVSGITSFAGRFYFSATDGVTGNEVWESDGTAINTKLTYDVHPSGNSFPGYFRRIGNKLILRQPSRHMVLNLEYLRHQQVFWKLLISILVQFLRFPRFIQMRETSFCFQLLMM